MQGTKHQSSPKLKTKQIHSKRQAGLNSDSNRNNTVIQKEKDRRSYKTRKETRTIYTTQAGRLINTGETHQVSNREDTGRNKDW